MRSALSASLCGDFSCSVCWADEVAGPGGETSHDGATSVPVAVAAGQAGESTGSSTWARSVWWSLVVVLAICLLAVFCVEPVTVGSDSMRPTLQSGDRVLIDKVTFRFHGPQHGDIVAFDAPASGTLTVKRVVGVAGDRVAIRDGVLWVAGHPRAEPYVDLKTIDSVYFGPTVVPPGTVFVMGDNRAESIDSRDFGPVPLSEVVGRVLRW